MIDKHLSRNTVYSIGATLIVLLVPVCQANVTKLMRTSASHMIAALGLLYEHGASWATFPLFKVLLEIIVTGSLMSFKHAFSAKLSLAKIASKRLLYINHSFAFLDGAKFKVRVRKCLFP